MKIIVFGFVFVILYLLLVETKYENMENTCPPPATNAEILEEMGETAQKACNRISSEAENIAAKAEGKSKLTKAIGSILNPIGALLDPKSYKSGDNKTETYARDLINNNLSTCDWTNIENICKINVSSDQSNVVNTKDCPFCQINGCDIKGVTQKNNVEIENRCIIETIVDTLLNNKGSAESQALADTIQESQGALSGDNTYKTEDCSIINNDMSSTTYLNNRSECVVKNAVKQENRIEACGNVSDIIQENHFKALNECIVGTDKTIKTNNEGKAKSDKDRKNSQKSENNISTISASAGIILICSGAIALYLYMTQTPN